MCCAELNICQIIMSTFVSSAKAQAAGSMVHCPTLLARSTPWVTMLVQPSVRLLVAVPASYCRWPCKVAPPPCWRSLYSTCRLLLQVDYYGAPTPLKQLAGISVPEATMLVVQPYDKSALPEIERAIVASDLGITPSNDGNLIRLKVPALTAVSTPEHCASS